MVEAKAATATGGGNKSTYTGGSAPSSSGEGKQFATYEMVRDMIGQSEEKLANKLESIETRIDQKLSKLDSFPTTATLVYVIGGSAVSALAILIGILAFAGDRFDGGVQVSSVSVMQAEEARRIAKENESKIDSAIDRFNIVLDRLEDDARKK